MISKKTKYAILALKRLAIEYNKGKTPLLISDISQSENIPKKFLEVILLEMRNAGILGSKKGKGGGYYLIKSPEDVNLMQIFRLMDGPIAIVPCASMNYYEPCEECKDEAACSIKKVAEQVRDASLKILKGSTLASMIAYEENSTLKTK
jgi:Rrf2 family protein